MEVTLEQRWLGMKPYVLIELDEDGLADIDLGGNPTEDEAEILFKFMKRAIKPLRAGIRQSIRGQREQP